MKDIIDLGIWAKLSPSAKTLYIVLLKFSDQNFKPVWPSTNLLLELTGFKTKKSIIEGKKDLEKHGLLNTVNGKGHKNSLYHFRFDYREVYKNTPLRDKDLFLRGLASSTSEASFEGFRRDTAVSPNNINITITNNPNLSIKENDIYSIEQIIEKFGKDLFYEAMEKLRLTQDSFNTQDIYDYCMSLKLSDKNLVESSSWNEFLNWSKDNLSYSTYKEVEMAEARIEKDIIILENIFSDKLRKIITKYFTDKCNPSIMVVFSKNENKIQNRLV